MLNLYELEGVFVDKIKELYPLLTVKREKDLIIEETNTKPNITAGIKRLNLGLREDRQFYSGVNIVKKRIFTPMLELSLKLYSKNPTDIISFFQIEDYFKWNENLEKVLEEKSFVGSLRDITYEDRVDSNESLYTLKVLIEVEDVLSREEEIIEKVKATLDTLDTKENIEV